MSLVILLVTVLLLVGCLVVVDQLVVQEHLSELRTLAFFPQDLAASVTHPQGVLLIARMVKLMVTA